MEWKLEWSRTEWKFPYLPGVLLHSHCPGVLLVVTAFAHYSVCVYHGLVFL